MAVSVRMDPLLEKELEAAAQRQGITKSQFIIQAVERALGRKDPFALMQRLIAEEEQASYKLKQAYAKEELMSLAGLQGFYLAEERINADGSITLTLENAISEYA